MAKQLELLRQPKEGARHSKLGLVIRSLRCNSLEDGKDGIDLDDDDDDERSYVKYEKQCRQTPFDSTTNPFILLAEDGIEGEGFICTEHGPFSDLHTLRNFIYLFNEEYLEYADVGTEEEKVNLRQLDIGSFIKKMDSVRSMRYAECEIGAILENGIVHGRRLDALNYKVSDETTPFVICSWFDNGSDNYHVELDSQHSCRQIVGKQMLIAEMKRFVPSIDAVSDDDLIGHVLPAQLDLYRVDPGYEMATGLYMVDDDGGDETSYNLQRNAVEKEFGLAVYVGVIVVKDWDLNLTYREDVLAIVAHCWSSLEYASDLIRADKEALLVATANDGKALQFGSDALKRGAFAAFIDEELDHYRRYEFFVLCIGPTYRCVKSDGEGDRAAVIQRSYPPLLSKLNAHGIHFAFVFKRKIAEFLGIPVGSRLKALRAAKENLKKETQGRS